MFCFRFKLKDVIIIIIIINFLFVIIKTKTPAGPLALFYFILVAFVYCGFVFWSKYFEKYLSPNPPDTFSQVSFRIS